MPLDCLFPTDFHTTLLLRTLVPLAILLVLGLAGVCTLRKAEATTNLRAKASREWLGNLLITLVLVLLFLIYPSVCTAVFSTFPCMTLDDGSSVLRVDLLIDCDSPAHQGMIAHALAMVGVYALGAPLLYAYLLFVRFAKPLRRLADIEARRVLLTEDAKAKDQYDRFDEAKGKLLALTSTSSDGVADEVAALKIKEAELRAGLPAYIRSLSGNGYAMRAFYFEIIECARLLLPLLAQLPSLLMLGSTG